MGPLINNNNHISSTINEMGPYRILRGRVNSVGFLPDECLIPYLELAGFGSAALIRIFDLRYDLIFALVERWRPETHTFHLPCGECTITLEDVTLQLRLPIDGNVVTGISSISRPAILCYELIGRSPSEGKFKSLRFSWLKANFEHLPSTANEWEVMQAVRAFIMHLIKGVLTPDANGSTTTDPSAIDIGECLILLQSWALYQMPFLASTSHQSYIFSLVNRWSTNPGIGRSYTVPIYCLMIENHAGEGCTRYQFSNSGVVSWESSTLAIRLHKVYPGTASTIGGDPWDEQEGAYGNDWGEPSLEYIQWYSEIGKPFLFGGQSMVVPPHTTRIGQPLQDLHHTPEPESEPEPKAMDIIQSLISSTHYHLSTPVILARIHLSTPLLSARIHCRTPLLPAQVHRWRLRHDFPSMFRKPLHTDEENVDCCNCPKRER
ncbi:hypothetical protein CXB51_020077 [Gossypium anomalum]|uniref:Aminotransferase-like plant mobile domain-containing protein n=1 Tax=Gossypium anomalum TaxID=47600 RepID=A0A8J5YJ41_9ROSI|nr:hypothetical protein CXB51_020077 [Gossypium anomalum]